jgi:UDP-2-acetamido-2-deoxy-ribo-hexuluronate aminotransferase
VLLAKLERFDWELQRRHELGARYARLLAAVPQVQLLAVRPDRDCVWGQYTVLVPRRAHVQSVLQSLGIPTAVHYPRPLHRQPAYEACATGARCAFSEQVAERVLSLPMSADLSHADQDRVVAALARALG